ncbi:MAG: type II toxin-antitoxin system VapC family toxin [Gammaproteobacteria bacterium]
MSRWVVDASVAIKWFLPEVHSESANRLLRVDYQLLSPDLIWAEFGNVLWKKWRREEIEAEVAQGILRDFLRFPLDVRSSEPLLQRAWAIAAEFDRTVYDSLYLALAQSTGCPVVTADIKLYNALKTTRFSPELLWVEDIPG